MPTPPRPPSQTAGRKDWAGIWGVTSGIVALVSCAPIFAALSGVLGFVSWRRAAASGRRSRLAQVALLLTGLALTVQLAVWHLATDWLLPSMERRTAAAIAAACTGDHDRAVADSSSPGLVAALPAPTESQVREFARQLQDAMGDWDSVTLISPEISGSPLAPTMSMAMVLRLERGDCSGSALVQWVPGDPADVDPWLPAVRVIELEANLPGDRVLRLAPPTPETP
jgi:hypothetical protein